ncbi:MAG TPA: biotin--[acetyl-CoA-carboxylase] ligase [Candidatus Omnitrophota bacterium]|nr:biotin--[acetyl-CoA-carboxylase] ligase [Candidatus Omnitrophota bacterium]
MKPDAVLDFLRDNRSAYHSGEELSKILKVTRSAVWKEIQNLRKLGYEIEARPHHGYRLLSVPDRLYADEIQSGLKTRFLGRQMYSYEELDSTNDACFKLGKEGVAEGVTLFAEYQNKGRGRLGRTWVSPRGKNILLSVLLRPALSLSDVSKITLSAAVSLIKAIREATGRALGIRWPNDVLFGDKKVAGILTEMSAEADQVNFIVLGIGINVNSETSELPAQSTSIKEIAGETIDRVAFARSYLEIFEKDYLCVKERRFEKLAREWEDYSATSGRRVVASLPGRKIQGQATGIDEEGALWIRTDSGLQERITAGDVQHLAQ